MLLIFKSYVNIDSNENYLYLGQYINDILNKYQDGLMILDYYNVHKNLNFSMKNKLSSVIINHELKHQDDLSIKRLTFLNLAKGILINIQSMQLSSNCL